PDLGVLVLCEGARCGALEEAIQIAPLLGHEVRCAPVTASEMLAGELAGIAERTRARRTHQRTIAALNQRIAADLPDARQARAAEYVGQLLDHAPIGIVALDAHGRVVAWNAHAHEIFGRSERSMLGAPLDPLFPDHERARWEACRLGCATARDVTSGRPLPRTPPRETFRMQGQAGLLD